MRKGFFAIAMAVPVAGCATTSFAPPNVNPQLEANVQGETGCVARTTGVAAKTITRDVEGAMSLTDNYILSYRCAERALANGRQFFQLPSFAAAVAGLVGPTLGLGHDGALIAGTTAGIFNTGNSYYAPRAKAGIVSAAYRALVCIKTEAAGIGYFTLVADDAQDDSGGNGILATAPTELERRLAQLRVNAQELEARRSLDPATEQQLRANWALQQAVMAAMVKTTLTAAAASSGGSIFLPAEVQYFQMVSGALFSVESILAERLRDAGSADIAEIFAQLTKLAEEHAAAKKALEDAKKKPGTDTGSGEGGGAPKMMTFSEAAADKQLQLVELENAVLRPKLQTCVLQARA